MSETIEERVVGLKFDNKQFESEVQTSLSTIDKLKQGLKFTGATRGLENIGSAVKNITLTPLSGAVETVGVKFSAMQVMAVTALQNITNSAVNAGKRIVSSLTVDPIKSGFSEYETQINAVQTILANTESKGKTLTDVNSALDELNAYADKTIYNFTEMTRNIGTFTAAGVDLDTSVAAIKGIANLAAVSGSTSQQASTAMYQLSQALASGTVKLMDWNSVTNAGMGGQVFQDSLIETARVHGVKIDEMIKNEGSFRETLSSGWLTSDILIETLSKFTGDLDEAQLKAMGYNDEQTAGILKMGKTANDAATKVKTLTQLLDTLTEAAQSGWTQCWEIIVGDFEEAKVMFTEVSDTIGAMIGASAEARVELVSVWKDLGGRTVLIDAIRNAFHGVMSIVTPVKEAFREIFPPMTGQQLYNLTEGLKNLTSKLILSEERSANLKSTFKGLFAILDIGKQLLSAVWNTVKPLIGGVGTLGDSVLGVTAGWGDWLVNLNETIRKNDIFNKSIQKAIEFIKNLGITVKIYIEAAKEKIVDFYGGVKSLVGILKQKIQALPGFEMFQDFLERLHIRMGQVTEAADDFKDGVTDASLAIAGAVNWGLITRGFEGFAKFFGVIWNFIKTVAGGIAKVCGEIGSAFGEIFANADFEKAFDILNSGLLASILLGIKKFVDGFEELEETFGSMFGGVGEIVDSVKDVFEAVSDCLEAYQQNLQAKTLLTIASAIAILAGSILVISMIDSAKLTASLGAVTVLFADLLASMALFSKISGSVKGVTKTVTAMIGVSTAVLILSIALATIGSLETEAIVKGLLGVAGLMAFVVSAALALSTIKGKIMTGAGSLVIFAVAINVLASACKKLSALSWEELAKGLVGVGVLMAEIALFLKTAKFSSKAVGTATGMVIMAAAIKILASACADFGEMEWSEIGKGLTAIGILLAELAIFTNLTGNAKKVVSTGTAMVLLGAAMKIFASAVKDFSGMSWEELAKGLIGMAGALTAVTVAVNFMPKNMVSKGVGLIAVATALLIVANALGSIGGMSWEGIAKGLTALAGSMTVLAVGLNVMKNTLPGSAALLIAAGALAILTPVLLLLGAMSWVSIAKGLIAIAGAFTVIGVAGLVLSPIVPAILGLAAAFALIGVGSVALGAGLIAIGAGITAISVAIMTVGGSLSAVATAFAASIAVIVGGLLGLIPLIVTKLGEMIVAICDVIVSAIPSICKAAAAIIVAVVAALVEAVPILVNGIFVLLDCVLSTLVEYTPKVVQAAFDILLACLKGIADNISLVVQTAIDVVIGFIHGVAQKIPDVIQSGIDLLLSFINGMAEGIRNNTDKMIAAVDNLMTAIVEAIMKWLVGFIETGREIIGSIIDGIKQAAKGLWGIVTDVISEAVTAVTDTVGDWIQAGKDLIGGFIKGVKDKAMSLISSVKGVIDDAIQGAKNLLGINSPSKVFAEFGKYTDEGFIAGLKAGAKDVAKATEDVGQGSIDAMSDAMSRVADIVNNDIDADPTIRPVVDLSNVKSGARNINALLSRNQAVSISASINKHSEQFENSDPVGGNAGSVYNFTQNNYSPKALSRADIYRQTKNQFSAMERMAKA